MENLNLLFYKTFYDKLGKSDFEDDIKAKSKRLVNSVFSESDYHPVCDEIAKDKFLMQTEYPGLIVGVGYAHGVDVEDDVKVGFAFDYVTGQPYIPGSSVKGLLRSYFAYPDVVAELLGDAFPAEYKGEAAAGFVKKLENNIFGKDDESGVDVFFDVVVKNGDKNGKVLSFDYITPHVAGATKNPTPIKILKILPEVVLEFSFSLKDSVVEGTTIPADKKQLLFRDIISHFGIGAKTNVGYGALSPKSSLGAGDTCTCIVTGVEKKRLKLTIADTDIKVYVKLQELNIDVKDLTTRFNDGDKIPAKILSVADGKFTVKLMVE